MRALLYLEWRYVAHNAAQVIRSRARLTIWVVYAIAIGTFSALRISHGHRHAQTLAPAGFGAASVLGLYCGYLALSLVLAAGGRVAAFRSNAEALLFSTGGVAPLTMALWLQARKVAFGWLRPLGSVLYLLLVFTPDRGGVSYLRGLLLAAMAFAIQLGGELPAFLLARRGLAALVYGVAALLAAFALMCGLADFGGSHVRSVVAAFVRFNPRTVADFVIAHDVLGFALTASLLVAMIAVVAALGRDALPELYAASQRTIERANRRRSPRLMRTQIDGFTLAVGMKRTSIPRGARALVWKDWIGFVRGRSAFWLWLVASVVWTVIGFTGAFLVNRTDDGSLLATTGLIAAMLVVIVAPATASTGLAAELSRPMFWLSDTRLLDRLVAWTFARAWRGGILVGLGPLAASAELGKPVLAAIAVPLGLVAYWSMQCLGVGLFALFPNPIDARGPMGLLRIFAGFVYLVPATVACAIAALLHGGVLGSTIALGATLAFEGWLVLELGSTRFADYGASLATYAQAR